MKFVVQIWIWMRSRSGSIHKDNIYGDVVEGVDP